MITHQQNVLTVYLLLQSPTCCKGQYRFLGVLGHEQTLKSYTTFDADFDAESNADKYLLKFDCLFVKLTISKNLIKFSIQRLRWYRRPFFLSRMIQKTFQKFFVQCEIWLIQENLVKLDKKVLSLKRISMRFSFEWYATHKGTLSRTWKYIPGPKCL